MAGPGTGIPNLEVHAGQAFTEIMLEAAQTLLFDHAGSVPGHDYQGINLRDGTWRALGALGLSTVSGTARSFAFHLGQGLGEDASVTVRTASSQPYAIVARFAAR